jgi:D-sedoheptulose 7-phosphate isomerase
LELLVEQIKLVREESGRVFFLGVGGSAANASHAVNDFRKLINVEAYAPTDNIAELTARTNDEGWETVFRAWLHGSHLKQNDCIFVLSVGGGDREKNISVNLCDAIDYAKEVGATVLAITGREEGYAAQHANLCIVVPSINPNAVTPHAESFQSIILHLIVSHPLLKSNSTKW